MSELLRKLEGGDRRSIGAANEVAALVLSDPSRLGELFDGLSDDNPLVSMRAADALEKVSVNRPDLLQPYRSRLLHEAAHNGQKEVQWHLAQMLGRLQLSGSDRKRAAGILLRWLDESDSQIVKVNSLQALTELSRGHRGLSSDITPLLHECARSGGPAVRARARLLLRSS